MDSKYRASSAHHKVLAILMRGETHVDKLHKASATLSQSRPKFQVDVIAPMIANGDVRQLTGQKMYGITNQGAEVFLTLQDRKPVFLDVQRAEQRTIKNNSMRDRPDYDGKELDQICMRPGAYDFLKCPSLVQGVRYYRKDAPK